MTPTTARKKATSRSIVNPGLKRKTCEQAQLAHIRLLHANLERLLAQKNRNINLKLKPLTRREEAVLDDLRFVLEMTQDRTRAVEILRAIASVIVANTTGTLTPILGHSFL